MKDYRTLPMADYDPAELEAYDEGLRFVFPERMHRVNACPGGEAWLILGSEKAALWDTGMCYQGEAMVDNIREILGDKPLDYVFLSHTHYDHLGGLPYVKQAYPDVVVCGAAYGQKVLQKPGALALMRELGEGARQTYGDENASPITTDGLAIDRALADGERIDLGGRSILAMETPGHTACSMSYAIEPERYLLASESTGVYYGNDVVNPAILKSFEDAMDSLEKMRAYGANRIFSCHYGMLPQSYNERIWDRFEYFALRERELIETLYLEGKSPEEIMDAMRADYQEQTREEEQTNDAFEQNAVWTIRLYTKDLKRD